MKTKSDDLHPPNHPNLFEALGFAPNPRAEMTARDTHREHVIIETLVKCMTNPTIFAADTTSAIPPPHEFLQKNRPFIEAERMARLRDHSHQLRNLRHPLRPLRARASAARTHSRVRPRVRTLF